MKITKATDVGAVHPRRYPTHKGDKGQLYGGTCNITACDNERAVFWNIETYGLYCPRCARRINDSNREFNLCELVDEKPKSVEEMNDMQKKYWAKRYNN